MNDEESWIKTKHGREHIFVFKQKTTIIQSSNKRQQYIQILYCTHQGWCDRTIVLSDLEQIG